MRRRHAWMFKDLTWPSHATSVKIPPQFLLSPSLNFYWHQSKRQCSQVLLCFDLSWGGEIVNTDFPVVFYRAIAALGCWPSSTILRIHVHSHWHWYSLLYSLSYHDHAYICALAQSYTHCRCSSLLSSDNKCLTSYSSTYFSSLDTQKIVGIIRNNCNSWGSWSFPRNR